MKKYFIFGLALIGLGINSATLHGATTETKLNLCNSNEEKIFISVAYQPAENLPVMARGWWGVEAKACQEISFPIVGDKVWVHAQSSSQIFHWVGETPLCVNSSDAYDLENAATIACNQSGQEHRTFKDYSLTDLRAVANGAVPTIKFTPEEATRVGGGLKLCNDTAENIYISFAQKKSTEASTTVNGWFMAKPGQCFEANRESSKDEILYFANSESGLKKWKGNIPLCTNDYDGFSHPNAETMDCTTNNLRLQSFTKEKLPESGVFTHHFKASEAYEARSVVDVCNSATEETALVIAFKDSEFNQIVSRGWYILKSGECAKEQVIDADELLLHIEKSDRTILMQGDYQACVNNEKAFQYSHATQMACSGVDDKKVGFAAVPIAAGKVRVDVP